MVSSLVGDELAIGGVPLSRLAARVGRTPFYAYDRALLTERVAALRTHLPERVHLSYAVKANPMPAVVQHLARLVDGCDVASAGELATVLDTGMDPDRISFAGPGKRSDELAQAVAAGVTLNVESAAELEEIARHGDRLGLTPRVAVRVNPDFELRGSGMRMGGGAKQFGVDAEDVPPLLARIGALDLTFVGFHCYWGSQALRPALIREAQEKSVELILRLTDAAPGAPELINLGGGFGIPYHDKDTPLVAGRSGRGHGSGSGSLVFGFAPRHASDRTGPLSGRRGRGICLPRGRSQGIARTGFSGHGWRLAPPPRGYWQLRSSIAPELSRRSGHPHDGQQHRDPKHCRLPLYTVGPIGRPRGASPCRSGRSGGDLSIWSLWRQRQPDGFSGAWWSCGSVGVRCGFPKFQVRWSLASVNFPLASGSLFLVFFPLPAQQIGHLQSWFSSGQ